MKSDKMRAIDEAAVARPWKWTDGKLLWNEEVDCCVLEHGGPNWPVSPENRVAIESAMNHMPALITLVAACERRRQALVAHSEFYAVRSQEDPIGINTTFEEHVLSLDNRLRAAEHDVDAALNAVHAVVSPPCKDPFNVDADPHPTWRSLARKIPMSAPMANLRAFVEGYHRQDLQDQRLADAIREGLLAYGTGSAPSALVRDVLENFVLQWVDPSRGPKMFLTDLARDVAVLVVAVECNIPRAAPQTNQGAPQMKQLRKVHLEEGSCKRGERGEQVPHHRFVEADDMACLTCARICGCDDCCVLRRDFGKWQEHE